MGICLRRLGLGVFGHQHDGQCEQQSDTDQYSDQRLRGALGHTRGNLRYIPTTAYVVRNQAEMPLLCAKCDPTPVDSLAQLR